MNIGCKDDFSEKYTPQQESETAADGTNELYLLLVTIVSNTNQIYSSSMLEIIYFNTILHLV